MVAVARVTTNSALGDTARRFVYLPRCPEGKKKLSPNSIAERRVSELIPVLGSQHTGDVSHKPGGWLPLVSARPALLPPQPLRGLLPIWLLGKQKRDGCEQFA